MADKAWKAFERYICRLFGGERRGPDNSDGKDGKNDCVDTPGWSIEIGLHARPNWSKFTGDITKAEQRRENPNDIPIAVFKIKGQRNDDAVVGMRLKTFREFFGDK